MGWTEKDQTTPFDNLPIPGLWFLDGNILAQIIQRNWTSGQKYPQVKFPSGKEFDIWETSSPAVWGIIHIFGEMDLPYRDTRDRAFEQASNIAEQLGYRVRKVGDTGLEVWGHDDEEHFLITYDDETGQMADISPVIGSDAELPVHPGHQLMSDEIREQLPGLGANEELGLEAVAPVKYFLASSLWTWYASEFDGEDTFFGLVAGFAVELGYFSLSELKSVVGPLGLPVERDLYYEPKTLRELQEQHRRERGE